MRKVALTALAMLFLLPLTVWAQPPAPQTIDQLVGDVVAIRKQKAELEKTESDKLAAIAAEMKRQTDLLAKLRPTPPAPVPPAPVPPPVPPVDPLRAKLKAAFDAAAGGLGEKAEWAKDLAALYRAAAKLATDPAYPTASALKAKLREAAANLIGDAALKEVRQVVAVELAAVLPTTDADLTDAQRAAAAGLFKALAGHLEEIGQ